MIVCLCNSIRDKDIRRAAARGARSVTEAYASVGCAPICGACVPYARRLLESNRDENAGFPVAD